MKTNKIFGLLLLLFISVGAFAHPPKKIELNYDKKTGKLQIIATHKVSDTSSHYLNELTISIDGEEVKKLEYSSQSSKEKHEAEIILEGIKKGSEIKVKINCNKMGAKSAKLVVD